MILDLTDTDALVLIAYHGAVMVDSREGRAGVVVPPTDPGLEFTLPENRMHLELPTNRMHFELPENRMHFEMAEED